VSPWAEALLVGGWSLGLIPLHAVTARPSARGRSRTRRGPHGGPPGPGEPVLGPCLGPEASSAGRESAGREGTGGAGGWCGRADGGRGGAG
jgi:hypothetical protein